jgi:hypothetical protein
VPRNTTHRPKQDERDPQKVKDDAKDPRNHQRDPDDKDPRNHKPDPDDKDPRNHRKADDDKDPRNHKHDDDGPNGEPKKKHDDDGPNGEPKKKHDDDGPDGKKKKPDDDDDDDDKKQKTAEQDRAAVQRAAREAARRAWATAKSRASHQVLSRAQLESAIDSSGDGDRGISVYTEIAARGSSWGVHATAHKGKEQSSSSEGQGSVLKSPDDAAHRECHRLCVERPAAGYGEGLAA